MAAAEVSRADYFAGHPDAEEVCAKLEELLGGLGPLGVRITKSQVAFRRRRGFAYLWMPGRYLENPSSEVVVSFALGRPVESPRLKEVVHVTPGQWMHHLEVRDADDLDEEVVSWLREAADRAG